MAPHRRTLPLRRHAALLCGLLPALLGGAARGAPEPDFTNGGHMRTLVADPAGGEARQVQALPLRHTSVRAEVAGVVASVEVTQHFTNPYARAIEAIYVFPLPHRAAVHAMEIRVGQRRIQGVVKERQEAQRIYDRARRAGQTASLLAQERPNIFTQSVANILPGEAIEVKIRYVETLVPEGTRYEFVFPMVVGPRYVGGGQPAGTRSGGGWGQDTDRIPDAARITPRLLRAGQRPGNDISLQLRVHGGVPLQHVQVVTHQATVRQDGSGATVTLDPRDAIPNKDFVVRYQLAGAAPQAALLASRDAQGGHFLLMIHPQARMRTADVAPREVVFVVDNSGSMDGFPVAQARRLVRRSLRNLRPTDTFQIIKFAGAPDQFAPRAVQASPDNVARGVRYVGQMQGAGGTEFLPALRAALSARKDPERARIVLFITDGYVGYEQEILRYLRQNIAGVNLFALGVGSSVNRFLIDGMARIGSGSPFYLLNSEKASSVVEQVFSMISRPALTHIDLAWDGVQVADLTPPALPDLFGDRPVVVTGRYQAGGLATVTVRGLLAGRPFSRRLQLQLPQAADNQHPAVPLLWARQRIAYLMDIFATEPERRQEVKQQVTATALAYGLVSRFTSMVAVDQRVRSSEGTPARVQQPVPLPEGVSERAAPPGAYRRAAASGVLGILGPSKASRARAHYSQGAPGASADDALGGLLGDQVGEAYGAGGLGLSGSGRGGGAVGAAAIGLRGAAAQGSGGVGYGRGAGHAMRGHQAVAPQIRVAQVRVTGALDSATLRGVIRRHALQIRRCYELQLQQHPGLAGRVVVKLTIGPDGSVRAAEIAASTLKDPVLHACILRVVRRWRFPAVAGGGVVEVRYPFVFKPGR